MGEEWLVSSSKIPA